MWRRYTIQISSICLKRWKTTMQNPEDFSTSHTPRDPPSNYAPAEVSHDAFQVPEFISPAVFREFEDSNELLGPKASKSAEYKNPEYFAYHRYSYFDLLGTVQNELTKRIEQRGVQTMYPVDDGSDNECDSDSDSDSDSSDGSDGGQCNGGGSSSSSSSSSSSESEESDGC